MSCGSEVEDFDVRSKRDSWLKVVVRLHSNACAACSPHDLRLHEPHDELRTLEVLLNVQCAILWLFQANMLKHMISC